MFLSAHIAEVGPKKAMLALQAKPDPAAIAGLRYAETYLTAALRTGMLPSLSVTGVIMIAAWDDDDSLDRFLAHPRAKPYENGWRVRMHPARSVGMLPGLPELPRRERPSGDSPVAAFTVGRVKASKFMPFIKTAGPAEREAVSHPGFIEGITIIRLPLVIGTFSLWRTAADMRHYAVGSYPGGHRRAIDRDRKEHFNDEMFFSRHIPYTAEGLWKGRNPLAMLDSVSSPGPAHSAGAREANGVAPRRGEPRHRVDV
jgi:hypothetical protein